MLYSQHYSEPAPRFWRVIHYTQDNRVHYDFSFDGISWINRYSLVGPYTFPLTDMRFRLIVGAAGAATAGTAWIDNVTSNAQFTVPNQPPIAHAGGPYTATTDSAVQFDGNLSSDTDGSIVNFQWNFGDGGTGSGVTPTHTYTADGIYTVTQTVADNRGATASATARVAVTTRNQSPTVNAGADQTITLPNAANLNGTVSDDGLPAGSSVATTWSQVSGPATVTFANAHVTVTTATFSAAGTYVLRLTAGDSQLTASDDLTIAVTPAPVSNQSPNVNAGPDQAATLGVNLLLNPGNEAPLVDGKIPAWTEASGSWTQASAGSDNFPASYEGQTYFYAAGETATAELYQDVDVSALAATINAGTQQFEWKAFLRSREESPADVGRIIVEYRNATNTQVMATLDSGPITTNFDWHWTDDTRAAPVGTGWMRIRLIGTRRSGATNDVYFDNLSLRAIDAAGVKLEGTASDDGLACWLDAERRVDQGERAGDGRIQSASRGGDGGHVDGGRHVRAPAVGH